jgi:subtilase family serine protease
MDMYNGETEYLLHPGDHDGNYQVDLNYSPQISGKHTVFCTVDPENMIDEIDESNNIYPFEFYVN